MSLVNSGRNVEVRMERPMTSEIDCPPQELDPRTADDVYFALKGRARCDVNVPRRELDCQPLSAAVEPLTRVVTVLAEI